MESPQPSGKKTVLLVTTLPSFLIPFMGSSVNIALPSIGKEFAMNAVLLGWVVTAYLLSMAMFLVPFGRIADILGRKKVFLWGISLYTFACLLTILSNSAILLIVFRSFQGIGASMVFGTAVAILTSVFPAHERGKALGINVAATYSGLSLGPFLGGLLTQYLGWRSIFWINIPLGLMVIGFAFWKLKGEWAEAQGERFDVEGSILYGLSLAAMIYGISLLPAKSGILLGGTGLLGILGFIRYEMKTESPIFEMNLFRQNRVFAFSNLAALINYSATFAVSFLLSLYLQYTKGFSPPTAGTILISQPIIQAIFSPFAGRLSDKIEPRIVASMGMALTATGLFSLTFLTKDTTVAFIIASLILLGFGFALFSSPNINAVMSSIDKRFYGVASGTLGTMRVIGMMLSMAMVMILFSIYLGRTQITPDHYPLLLKSIKGAFVIFAFLCIGGLFASVVRGKVR
ncbi:MAG: MFS transporter [Deltaproteobacteria bacterium RBG_16_48_10]|nr:MAG: MFS transporter [Deltaproteobacteria bacterium RBG_16_48_10]